MKRRQRYQLVNAAAAVVSAGLIWVGLCGDAMNWLLCLAPLTAVGVVIGLNHLAVVILSLFFAGRILIARADREAAKGHTIRKAKA